MEGSHDVSHDSDSKSCDSTADFEQVGIEGNICCWLAGCHMLGFCFFLIPLLYLSHIMRIPAHMQSASLHTCTV